LGVSLIAREGRGIILTATGASLARDIGTAFNAIRRGVDAVTGADAARPVQITMSPAFAVEWLTPRITEFQRRHPKITLMLNPTSEVINPQPGGIDLAIRYTDHQRLEKGVSYFWACRSLPHSSPMFMSYWNILFRL
jgi:LysR family glycine cleavage system transcriptional activator